MPLPRDSVYPFGNASSSAVPSPDFLNHLEDCIVNTENAVAKLSEAVKVLEPGVSNFPRLNKVLKNSHRFLVLPAPQIQAYQAQISSSIAPQIETLISRAEALISSQAARQANLEERLSIIASRHQPASRAVSASAASGKAAEDGDAEAEEEGEEVDFEHNYIADIPIKDYSIPQRRKIAGLKSRRARLEKEWKAHLAETGGE